MSRTGKILGIIAAVLVLIGVALPFLINANDFRPRIESALTNALGRKVTVGNLTLKLLPVKITAENLSIADDPAFSPAPFLQAKGLSLGVHLWPLVFSKKLEITDLSIDNPAIVLLQAPSGKWNFSSLGAGPQNSNSEADLSAKLVKIGAGRLSIGETGSRAKPVIVGNIQAEIRDFSPTAAFPFSFSSRVASGGDVSLQGQAGPLNRADAATTPLQANLKVTGLKLAESGFVDPAAGIDGLLSIDGKGVSNGSSLQWQGRLGVDKVRLARGGSPARESVTFDFAIDHNLRNHSGVLSRGEIRVGKASAALTGTYAQSGAATMLKLRLAGSNMPVSSLAGMLPPLGIVLPAGSSPEGGEVAVNLNVTGPVTDLVTSGSVGLRNTRIAGFDLGGKMSSVAALAGIKSGPSTEIQSLTADLRVTPEVTTVQNLKLVVPSLGEVDGAGTIGANHALDFKMVATVRAAGLLLAGLGQRSSPKVPFFVQGTSSNPVFKPDIQGIAAGELNRLQKGNLGKAADSILEGLFGGKK
jgi:AsmA protein